VYIYYFQLILNQNCQEIAIEIEIVIVIDFGIAIYIAIEIISSIIYY
jgi:hypothetical protein